jgi:hypothetical protein
MDFIDAKRCSVVNLILVDIDAFYEAQAAFYNSS